MRLLLLSLTFMATSAWAETSLYSFKLPGLSGKDLPLGSYKGKVVLLVNTASHCGFTKQFSALEKMYKTYREQGLVVIGVPSSSFKQEFKDEAEVAQFCKFNYGVTFPMTKIVEVKGAKAHPLYSFLVSKAPANEPGDVEWNFEKFLIDRQGQVVARYRSAVTPDAPELEGKVKELLAAKAKS